MMTLKQIAALPPGYPGYVWRGRTYKREPGLQGAVRRVYPGASLSFRGDTMIVRTPDLNEHRFARRFDLHWNSIIADQPE